MDRTDVLESLKQKLKDNYDVYIQGMTARGIDFVIENAPEIAITQQIYKALNDYEFSDAELSYFNQFRTPLEVVSDYYYGQNNEIFPDELCETMEDIVKGKIGMDDYEFDESPVGPDVGMRMT